MGLAGSRIGFSCLQQVLSRSRDEGKQGKVETLVIRLLPGATRFFPKGRKTMKQEWKRPTCGRSQAW